MINSCYFCNVDLVPLEGLNDEYIYSLVCPNERHCFFHFNAQTNELVTSSMNFDELGYYIDFNHFADQIVISKITDDGIDAVGIIDGCAYLGNDLQFYLYFSGMRSINQDTYSEGLFKRNYKDGII
jgi:hypothetical protein